MNTLFRIKYYFNSYWKGYATEAWQHLSAPFVRKNPPETKFVIFTGGRTGSSLLRSLLNSHPEIHCEGEILKGRMWAPLQFIKKRSLQSRARVYGFKLLSYQLRDVQSSIKNKREFLKALADDGYKIIYLERKDKHRQSLSVAHAMHTDYWHDTGGNNQKKPEAVLPSDLIAALKKEIERLTAFEKDLLEGLDYLPIQYERDLSDEGRREQAMASIFKLLQVPYEKTHSPYQKVLSSDHHRLAGTSQSTTSQP